MIEYNTVIAITTQDELFLLELQGHWAELPEIQVTHTWEKNALKN